MDALELTKRLVEIETPSQVSNIAASDFLQDRLQALEFETERICYNDDNDVLKVSIAAKRGSGPGGIAYFGHSDVVPADTWFTDEFGPFSPTVKQDRLYGRGSCDMKGSVACFLAAIEQFQDRSQTGPIYFVCTADEEIGYGGASSVAQQSRFYREAIDGEVHGIIGEPTRLAVVYAHKGTYGFQATSHGQAAHSSTREGRNANLAMIPFLAEMKAIHDETENDPKWQNDEFDPPTVSWNIGINDHTRAINIKPPQSICTVYFRPMPGIDPDALLARAAAAAQRCGLDFEVTHQHNSLYADPASEFVRQVTRLAGQDEPQTVSYGTDGSCFRDLKNVVVLGPGDIAQAHTHDEFIELEQLEAGTKLYLQLIQRWCG